MIATKISSSTTSYAELFQSCPRVLRLPSFPTPAIPGTVTRAAVNENLPGLKTPDERRSAVLTPALIRQIDSLQSLQAIDPAG
jgi:hypothetical protein